MAHNPITLDLLRALQAIDQHGSFAAAAEALHKVPSALTYTIQKVEKDLELELFNRSGHKAIITDAGSLILAEGKRILESIDSLAQNAKQVASGWEPKFNLVFDTVVDIALLLPVVKQFQTKVPFVNVGLKEESLSGTWDKLKSGEANLIISTESAMPTSHPFESKQLSDIEMVLAVAPDHPVAKLAQPVNYDTLSDYKVVVINDSSASSKTIFTGLARNNRQFIVPNMTYKIEAQAAGLGIGYLPKWRIRKELENGILIEIKTREETSKDHLMLAWHRDNNGKALAWFIDEISLAIQDYGI